jgi:hypothetical protein
MDGAELLRTQAEYAAGLARLLPAGGEAAARLADCLEPPMDCEPPVEGAKWTSPDGAQVLMVLGPEYQTAGAIAHHLGWTASPRDKPPDKLYFLLSEYAARGLIDKSNDGYRLPPAAAPVGANSSA